MNEKDELIKEIKKHTPILEKALNSIRIANKGPDFEELYKMALAYFNDSKYFFEKKRYVQSFEALIISWAYLDSGLRLGIFELLDSDLLTYFTIDST